MEKLYKHLSETKRLYDRGAAPINELQALTDHALCLLENLQSVPFDASCEKPYRVYELNGRLSRPFLPTLLETDRAAFGANWKDMIDSIESDANRINASDDLVNRTIYTSVMSFAICIDLWKPRSRKTPGTFYEILLGSVMSHILPTFNRLKYIRLPDNNEKVTTDIVFDQNGHGLVIPVKISTRERIVQPYAHQRILDSVFGMNRYRSILVCANETQRQDNGRTTNDICVPGTIKLFQTHLSSLSGLYYLDPPIRYLQKDLTDIIDVETVGRLLTTELPDLIKPD